jgi:hypothetical protein
MKESPKKWGWEEEKRNKQTNTKMRLKINNKI